MKQNHFAVAVLISALSCATVGGARAAEASPAATNSVSLTELVNEALAKNPELKFYEAELLAAKAGRKTAGSFANPEISGGVGQKRVTSSGFSAEGTAWTASVVQPFEWPGRLGLRKAIAHRDIELAELGATRFKVALAGQVRTLAYSLFVAQEKSIAAGEVAERFKALREVLVQRDSAGLTPLLETRVIEATELNAQRKASEAALAADSIRMQLNQLRGADSNARLTISQGPLNFRALESVDELVACARTNHYEVRVRAVELAQQGFRVDLAKNERFPAIAIGPTVSEEKVGSDRERIIGVGVAFPLPLWNSNSGNIEAAKARQSQAKTSLLLTQRDAERLVTHAAQTYAAKLREMANWRPDSVQHFKEAADLADRHYRLGAVPIATFVDAVESLLDTKREALQAAAQLELLTGLPLPLAITANEEKP